jgi:large subunit ribosomal protein L18
MLSNSRKKRSDRVRFKIKKSNKNSMRLSIFKSSKHLYIQVIDDEKGITICNASSIKFDKNKNSCNLAIAKILGAEIAKVAKEKGISKIYLDRGSNIYHGIIKTIADEARSSGLNF